MLCVSIQIFFITCGGDTNLSGLTSGRISGVSIKSNQIMEQPIGAVPCE